MTGKPRALVIDDDASTRFFLRIALETRGFQVYEAAAGESGLVLCDKIHPHVVLVDYRMPGMDGAQCCQALRQQPSSLRLPIILLSGREDPQLHEIAREAGADRFMQKPTDWLRLAGVAADLVNKGRATSP